MLEFIGPAALHLFEPVHITLMLAGLTGGIVVGSLPGLTATMGVALMVPATFAMDATSGLIMLGAIYAGAIYGGANAAVLICTPGTPSSVATTFDGWPLCRKGKADIGLYGSLLSSSFGGIIGTLMLLFLTAPLARFALKFGAPEILWLCLFGLSTIAVMSSGNMLKGLLSGAIGILVSCIGLDPHEGSPRFIFGYAPLVQGISIIPAMIGLFSFSQVLFLLGSHKPYIADYCPTPRALHMVFSTLAQRCKLILLRSSIIGGFVGMLPGAGGEIASIIAYNESKRWDKRPEKYGSGILEGVAASESANNAVIGGALIPMLTLGIPGSAVAAVILGVLLAKGIQPGFKVFTVSGDLVYTFIMSQFAVNLLMIPVGFLLVKLMTRLLKIRLTIVAIAIVVFSAIGAYAIGNSMLDVWVVLCFGFFGHWCGRIGLDNGAVALGIILGVMIDHSVGRTTQLALALDGSVLQVFLNSPVALVLAALTGISLLVQPFLALKDKSGVIKEKNLLPTASPLADALAGVTALVIAAIFAAQLDVLEGMGRTLPELLLAFISLCGLLLLGNGARKYLRKVKVSDGEAVSGRRIAIVAAGSVIYVVIMPWLGFYPASMIFLCGMTLALRDQRASRRQTLRNALTVTASVCLLVWIGFTRLLNVPTPTGVLF